MNTARGTEYTFNSETFTVTWQMHGNKRSHTFKPNKAWTALAQLRMYYARLQESNTNLAKD